MSKTLVTGATGLVGYNIADALRAQGREVLCLVRDAARARSIVPLGCHCVEGDVTRPETLARALEGVEVVYHAAGLPEQWLRDEDLFRRVNVEGTRHMVDAALAAGVRKFLYTSTIDVFRAHKGQAYDERVIDEAPKGTPYERSKQEADRVVVAALERGLHVVFLHPSGVYGPGPAASPGLNDLLVKLSRNEVPMLLPGGLPVVYSEDVGLGHVLAESRGHAGDRFILSQQYYALTEIVEAAKPLLGLKRIPLAMPLFVGRLVSEAGEALARVINKPPLIPRGQLHFLQWQAQPQNRNAREKLGWQPTPLEKGLELTIAFLRQTGRID